MSGDGDLCAHCHLPLGRRPTRQRRDGATAAFCCYGCRIAHQVKEGRGEESEAAWLLIRFGIGAFLSMNIMMISLFLYAGVFSGADAYMLPWVHGLLLAFATPTLAILGGPFLRESLDGMREGQLPASVLIVIGVAAAYLYSLFAMMEGSEHVYFDTASMVLLLFTLGRYLEAAGRARAAGDLEPLLAAENARATVVVEGAETEMPAREIISGMRVRVRPGERIPIDGVVIEGESWVDEAVITGESRQLAKSAGAAVVAGSINFDGSLLVESSGPGSGTRWAQICRSVRAALAEKSATQRLGDRIVAAAVPLVLLLAALTVAYRAQFMPLNQAMLAGLAVLVVACPCAVGLAAPLATTLGIGRLARCGCVARGPAVLEALASVRSVAFDKTGTLTTGRPRLIDMALDGCDSSEALRRASGLEQHSEHALARAVMDAATARNLSPCPAWDVRAAPGRGITGTSADGIVAGGNEALMRDLGWSPPPLELARRAAAFDTRGYTVIWFGWSGRARAVLALDDQPQPEARETLEALKTRGLGLLLLTGDRSEPARRLATAVGLDEVAASLSPEEKQVALGKRRQQGGPIAMVGDGLNDGPVLAAADVGIAVGNATDLARETASLVLPAGGLWLLPWLFDLALAVRRTILSNLLWAFGYNLVALTAAACGLLQPILAAAVMAGSSILVVLNSLRLERLPEPSVVGKQLQGAPLPSATAPDPILRVPTADAG